MYCSISDPLEHEFIFEIYALHENHDFAPVLFHFSPLLRTLHRASCYHSCTQVVVFNVGKHVNDRDFYRFLSSNKISYKHAKKSPKVHHAIMSFEVSQHMVVIRAFIITPWRIFFFKVAVIYIFRSVNGNSNSNNRPFSPCEWLSEIAQIGTKPRSPEDAWSTI